MRIDLQRTGELGNSLTLPSSYLLIVIIIVFCFRATVTVRNAGILKMDIIACPSVRSLSMRLTLTYVRNVTNTALAAAQVLVTSSEKVDVNPAIRLLLMKARFLR